MYVICNGRFARAVNAPARIQNHPNHPRVYNNNDCTDVVQDADEAVKEAEKIGEICMSNIC